MRLKPLTATIPIKQRNEDDEKSPELPCELQLTRLYSQGTSGSLSLKFGPPRTSQIRLAIGTLSSGLNQNSGWTNNLDLSV